MCSFVFRTHCKGAALVTFTHLGLLIAYDNPNSLIITYNNLIISLIIRLIIRLLQVIIRQLQGAHLHLRSFLIVLIFICSAFW